MSFYAFENKVLEQYLRKMANKGWKLVKLQGLLKNMMIFEKCEPQNIYYYVDVGTNYSIMFPNSTNPSQAQYRAFLEEYGYDFVSSNGPIEVYSSKEESKLPIHEEDETRNEELRKIAKRELLVNIFLPLLYIFIGRQMFTGAVNFYFANIDIVLGFFYVFVACIWLSMLYPYVRWLVHKKKVYKLRNIILRTYLQICMAISLTISLFFFMNENLGLVSILFIIILMIVKFITWIDERAFTYKKKLLMKIITLILFGYLLFSFMLQYTLYSVLHQDVRDSDKQAGIILPSLQMKEVTGFQQESMFSEVIKTYDKDTADFTYIHLKNTLLKGYMKARILNEQKYKKVAESSGLTIYQGNDNQLLIAKDNQMIVFHDTKIKDEVLKDIATFYASQN